MPLTPQQLEQARASGNNDAALVSSYAQSDPDFASKYEQTKKAGLKIADPKTGQPMSAETISLNYATYGNPYGPQGQPQQKTVAKPSAMPPKAEKQGIGERFMRGFGNKEVRDGKQEVKGFDQGLGAAIKDIPGDLADVAGKALPFGGALLGGAVGAVLGTPLPVAGNIAGGVAGAGVGAGIGEVGRQSFGDLFGVNQKYGTTKEGKTSFGEQKDTGLGEIGKEGLIGAASEFGGRIVGAGAKMLAKKAKPLFAKLGSVITNVDEAALNRAFEKPDVMRNAIKEAAEAGKNEQGPFFSLAKNVHGKMTELRNAAKTQFTTAVSNFTKKYEGATFDATQPVDVYTSILKPYNINVGKNKLGAEGKDLLLDQYGGSLLKEGVDDTGKGFSLRQSVTEPLEDAELNYLGEVLNKITTKYKNLAPSELVAAKQFFKKMYERVDDTKGPKLYHKILMEMKEKFDEGVHAVLPDELKAAYKPWADTARMMQSFGKTFGEEVSKGKFVVNKNAETFLMKLNTMNKTAQREQVEELSKMLGIDIADQAQFASDAGKLMRLLPATKDRQTDVIRSLLISGAGGVAGAAAPQNMDSTQRTALGAVGIGAGLAITSPRLAGKAMMSAGASNILAKLQPVEKSALYFLLESLSSKKTGAGKKTPGTAAPAGRAPIKKKRRY